MSIKEVKDVSTEDYEAAFRLMLKAVLCRSVIIKTKYTSHYIEHLMPTCHDRGRWKWIAETNSDAWKSMDKDAEAKRSHIDGQDLFPRLYFRDDSLVDEVFSWIKARELTVTDLIAPSL